MKDKPYPKTGEADNSRSASFVYPSFDIEKEFLDKGYRHIAGVDEAGRGSLAGPLCVGLVIFRPREILSFPGELFCINDSKKMSPAARQNSLPIIHQKSLIAHHGMVSHRVVDRINVNRATEFALSRLLDGIDIKPDVILLDGNFTFELGVPVVPVSKGDNRSISIAAAGIVAKVNRDCIMEKMDSIYAGFNFKQNKGYGTREHIAALEKNGHCPIHRTSYEPVKTLVYS